MPDGYDAVIINTTFIAPEETTEFNDVCLIIAEGNDGTETAITYFDSLEKLLVKYPTDTYPAIAKCATCLTKNGATRMAVGIYDGVNSNISALYDMMESEARVHNIINVVLAGYLLDGTTVTKLKPTGSPDPLKNRTLIKFCDDNQLVLIIAFAPPSTTTTTTGVTVDSITKMVYDPEATTHDTTLISPNLYLIAYNDPAATDDIAGCVAGVMGKTNPQITMMWKTVKCDISEYFNNNDVRKLEGKDSDVMIDRPHINVILEDYGLSESFTPDRYIKDYNEEGSIIRDISITRTIYYIKRLLQEALIDLRRNVVKLSYTAISFSLIQSTITTVLENNKVTALNPYGAITDYSVILPKVEDVTAYEKSLNILKNVKISIVLAGEIHKFEFSMIVSLGGN